MAKFRNLFYIVLIVLLFVEVLIIFPAKLEKARIDDPFIEKQKLSDEEDPESEASRAKRPKEPTALNTSEQKMKGMHVVESKSGQRDWELFSVTAEGSQGKGSWNLHQVRALFYNSEKVEFTVTGDDGIVDPITKDLKVRGHVVIQSTNGYSFKTATIHYNAKTRIIESPEKIEMKGPYDEGGEGLLLVGGAMQVIVDSSKILIKNNVDASKELKGKKKVQIRSNKAEFSGKNREAHFVGSVFMVYDKMKIEGPEASFAYKPDQDILSTILVRGGVKVSDGDKLASAENLNLDVLENTFTFRGKPKIIQNEDELVGDEITFLDGGKRVKVNKVRARIENANEK